MDSVESVLEANEAAANISKTASRAMVDSLFVASVFLLLVIGPGWWSTDKMGRRGLSYCLSSPSIVQVIGSVGVAVLLLI